MFFYNKDNLPGPNDPSTWIKLAELLYKGKDLVHAVVASVFDAWPNDAPGEHYFENKYTMEAPDVQMLEAFRDLTGYRALGSWKEKSAYGWASEHSREETVALCNAIARAFDGE